MNALAIDTSTRSLVVSLKKDEEIITVVRTMTQNQSESLLPLVDKIFLDAGLVPADLDCYVVASGPGSFTSLRLSYSCVKGFSLAHQKPIYAMPTLDAHIATFKDLPVTKVCVMDARQENYFTKVVDSLNAVICDTVICNVAEIASLLAPILQNSNGAALFCGPEYSTLAKLKQLLLETVPFCNKVAYQSDYPSLFQKIWIAPPVPTINSLFEYAQKKLQACDCGIRDFDGPVYMTLTSANKQKS